LTEYELIKDNILKDQTITTTYFPDVDSVRFMHKESGVGFMLKYADLERDMKSISELRNKGK
jgi:hypothetical protein